MSGPRGRGGFGGGRGGFGGGRGGGGPTGGRGGFGGGHVNAPTSSSISSSSSTASGGLTWAQRLGGGSSQPQPTVSIVQPQRQQSSVSGGGSSQLQPTVPVVQPQRRQSSISSSSSSQHKEEEKKSPPSKLSQSPRASASSSQLQPTVPVVQPQRQQSSISSSSSSSSGGGSSSTLQPFVAHGSGVDPTVASQGHPLGFTSLQHARDATRRYAELDRNATVYVRGSSVTGQSYTSGNPFGPSSDIDVGMVSRNLSAHGDFITRGGRSFPGPGTSHNVLEGQMSRALGRDMGLAVTTDVPSGPYMERPHTPRGERREVPELPAPRARGGGGRGGRGGGRGRGGSGGGGRGGGGQQQSQSSASSSFSSPSANRGRGGSGGGGRGGTGGGGRGRGY